MKKLYTTILIIAVTLFISCDENKAKDEIKKALDKTVDADKTTPKPKGSGTLDAGGSTPPPPAPTLT